MSKLKLLDCTLRDGGYINNWRFGKSVINAVCQNLFAANIDIIEVGFLTDRPHGSDESLYSGCEEVREKCFCNGTSKLAAMIALGEKEFDPTDFPCCADSPLEIIRITFHQEDDEIQKAIKYAAILMEKGYKVCMQPVGTTAYSDKDLLSLIEMINQLKPYAFYLVDTLGILCREELLRFIFLIDYNLDECIKIGFHSHNNLQMSFANAQLIAEYHSAREFIIDCSVYGMGRGAGNLCTELIAQYLNGTEMSSYNMVPIYETLDTYIYPIYLVSPWGYSAHYYISAAHKCHPNYAAFLMNKQTLTMNQIDLILKNLPIVERDTYNKKLIEEMYYNFQNKSIDDSENIEELKKYLCEKNILILAPGKSISIYSKKIKEFISEFNPTTITINGSFDGYVSDFVFISNLKRLYSIDLDKIDSKMIITSNLPNIVRGGYYVDYSSLCNKEFNEPDNSGIMLIRLMRDIGIKKIYIAGFDGFDETVKNNYYTEKMMNSVNPENISDKNYSIATQLHRLEKSIDIEFLTPSKYTEIKSDCGEII